MESSKATFVRQQTNTNVGKKKVIPPNLLTKPLPDTKTAQMGKEEKQKYRMWQERYKILQTRLDKQEKANEHPKNK